MVTPQCTTALGTGQKHDVQKLKIALKRLTLYIPNRGDTLGALDTHGLGFISATCCYSSWCLATMATYLPSSPVI